MCKPNNNSPMKKYWLTTLAVAGVLTFTACESNSQKEAAKDANEETVEARQEASEDTASGMMSNNGDHEDDADFLVDAAYSGMKEISFSKLALEKSNNASVKEFAQLMVKDHTKMKNELTALAQQKSLVLPTDLDEEGKEKLKEFSNYKGAEFDKEYMDKMAESHEKVHEKFEKFAQDAKDPAIKDWANSCLPMLGEHMNKAKTLDEQLENKGDRNM
jgi:putative membrane protein